MKKIILSALIFILINHLQAQVGQANQAVNKQNDHKIKNNKNRIKKTNASGSSGMGYTIQNSSAHYAYGNPPTFSNTYTIQDPVLQVMNLRANGSDIKMGKSGIIGEGKRTYGFANGHLVFYSSGATS